MSVPGFAAVLVIGQVPIGESWVSYPEPHCNPLFEIDTYERNLSVSMENPASRLPADLSYICSSQSLQPVGLCWPVLRVSQLPALNP